MYKAMCYLRKRFFKKENVLEAFVKKKNVSTIPQSPILDINIFGVTTLYLVVFFACSFLSLVFDGYFYCICLLYVIVNNDILLRVLRAVTQNGQSEFSGPHHSLGDMYLLANIVLIQESLFCG